MTVFKDIPGYEGLYQISNNGDLLSFYWHGKPKVRVITPSLTLNLYLYATLYKDGVRKTYGIHRLVAMAFLPSSDQSFEVNHKDHNPLNNNVENLEWISHKDNVAHSWKNPIRGKKFLKDKIFKKHISSK
jgi:hypothetical protein